MGKTDTVYYKGEKTQEFFYKLPNGEQFIILMGPHNRKFEIPREAIILHPITREPITEVGEPVNLADWGF